MKKFKQFMILALAALAVASCNDDELDPQSIFDTTPPVRTEFDSWILDNYTYPFNIDLKYRFEDVESDVEYNLIPAAVNKSLALSKLIRTLWIDSYLEVADSTFLKTYCPKMIHLVGSPQYEKEGGSMTLGAAEGGLKITLFNVNGMDLQKKETDPDAFVAELNQWYFLTMHHEFAHILHQTKNYSTEFNEITEGKYTGQAWENTNDSTMRVQGFVSAYASKEVDEDFVETIAHYVVKSEAEWKELLKQATVFQRDKEGRPVDKEGNPVTEEEALEKAVVISDAGRQLILEKLEMVTSYLADTWSISIEDLHQVVMKRQEKVAGMDLTNYN